MAVEIIHEDARLLVLSKPSGQAVIPGRGLQRPPLSEDASRHAGAKVFVVHRIDLEASGLVAFAKDAATHRRLSMAFEQRTIRKQYLALAAGVLERSQGRIDAPLSEFGSGRVAVDAHGKESLTTYRVIEPFAASTLLEVEPKTGRKHQIRAHLYSMGHPLVGDTRYGPKPPPGSPRLMLHAWRLWLPVEGAPSPLRLEAPPPPDFEAALAAARQARAA